MIVLISLHMKHDRCDPSCVFGLNLHAMMHFLEKKSARLQKPIESFPLEPSRFLVSARKRVKLGSVSVNDDDNDEDHTPPAGAPSSTSSAVLLASDSIYLSLTHLPCSGWYPRRPGLRRREYSGWSLPPLHIFKVNRGFPNICRWVGLTRPHVSYRP